MSWLSNFFRNFKLTSDGSWNVGRSTSLPGASKSGLFSGFGGISQLVDALVARLTANELTGAEREANEFSAGEAQKSRDFTEYMTRNKYQMETQSMEQAGLNPAMVYGGGQLVPTAANGAQANSVAPQSSALFDFLPTLMRMPAEIEELKAAAQQHRDEGKAALQNANTNARNAGANEMNADTNRMRQEVDAYLAKFDIRVKEETANNLAADTAYILKNTSQLDDRLAIMYQNADSQRKSAIAALQSSLASLKQAVVAEKLSDSEIALRQSQILVNWAATDGQQIVNKNLDAKMQSEIRELHSRSDMLSANAEYMDGQKKVLWMQTVTGYANAACNIVNTGLGVATGIPSKSNPIGF